jgi:hypothetical protein
MFHIADDEETNVSSRRRSDEAERPPDDSSRFDTSSTDVDEWERRSMARTDRASLEMRRARPNAGVDEEEVSNRFERINDPKGKGWIYSADDEEE